MIRLKFICTGALMLFLMSLTIQGRTQSVNTDLTIESALTKTLSNNYGIQVSRAESEVANINNSWGRAGRYPSVTADMGLSQSWSISNSQSSSSQRLSPGIGLRWVLFDGFKVTMTKDKLNQLEELSNGQSMVVIENTIEDVILAYYNILLQQEKLKVYQKMLQLASDRYDYEMNRKELGGTVSYQVLLAKNEFLGEKALVMSQEVMVRNSYRTLNFLMGVAAETQWTLNTPFEPVFDRYEVDELLLKMKQSNQVLKNQYLAMSLKAADEKLARAELFPSLTFNAGIDYTGSQSSNGYAGNLAPGASLTIAYDIFNGGVRKDAIEIAKINRQISSIDQLEIEHALTNQLYGAHDNYLVRQALLNVSQEIVEAASLNLDIASEKYRSGLINQFNYRDIQLIYQSAAIQRLEAVFDLIESHTALTRLTGGFLSAN